MSKRGSAPIILWYSRRPLRMPCIGPMRSDATTGMITPKVRSQRSPGIAALPLPQVFTPHHKCTASEAAINSIARAGRLSSQTSRAAGTVISVDEDEARETRKKQPSRFLQQRSLTRGSFSARPPQRAEGRIASAQPSLHLKPWCKTVATRITQRRHAHVVQYE